jgi:hypothetical protein
MLLSPFLDKLYAASIEVVIVKLVNSSLHVTSGGKLDNSFIFTVLMSIGIGDVTSLSHQILQILPRYPGGEILHSHPVVGPCGRAVPAPISGSISSCAPGMFDRHPLAENLLPVELVDRVIRVPVVLKLHKAEPLLDQHVRLPPVALEELFQISFPRPRGKIANVNPAAPRHF